MDETVGNCALVSQLDDLFTYGTIFHEALETEFLTFVQSHKPHPKWSNSKEDLKNLQNEYEITSQELKHWKANFEEMRINFDNEKRQRIEIENQLADLVAVLQEIKDVVDRDTSLSNKTKERFAVWQKYELWRTIPDDETGEQGLDFDKSGEVLDFGKGNPTTSPQKMIGSSVEDCFVTAALVTAPNRIIVTTKLDVLKQDSLPPATHGSVQDPIRKRRSHSEPEAIILVEPQLGHGELRPAQSLELNADEMSAMGESGTRTSGSRLTITPTLHSSSFPVRHNSGSKLNGRAHDFASKTVIKPETCMPCGRRIKFYKTALKCHNCRATCHPECKGSVPLPCILATRTPNKIGKTVADFAPTDPPRIPNLILLCVSEVEARGKSEVGLYRLSASDKDVLAIKEKFEKTRGLPDLRNADVHVLCATIKDFLRRLEPLIPKLTWKEFASAAAMKDLQESQAALYQCIGHLPLANRDTLAFLILHWQRIAENAKVKMPIKNLALVLGPTIVGNLSRNTDPGTILEEQAIQVQVMEKLLLIPSEFWNSFFSENEENPFFKDISSSRCLEPGTSISPRSKMRGHLGKKKRLFTSPSIQ